MAAVQEEKNRCIKYKFVHSVTLEMIKSIHVVADPEHHVYCSSWVKKIQCRMSEKLRSEIRFFADRYAQWSFIMDLVGELAYYRGGANDFDMIVEKIRTMKPSVFAVFFLGLSSYRLDEKEVARFIRQPQEIRGDEFPEWVEMLAAEDVRNFLTHIEETRDRLCRVMEQYWLEVFSFEWESINNYLTTVIKRGITQIERYGLINYICSFHDKIYVEKDRLILDKGTTLSIKLDEIKEIVITPSLFSHPHLYGNIFRGKVNIALSMNYNAVKINDAVPAETLKLMHVLSDDTRYRIIKALWNSEATPSELSELLTLSLSTISLQLKVLKEAGIVEMRKVNKNVYYRLIKEPMYTIQKKFIDSLDD